MGVYIPGMEMPKDAPVIIKVCPDGSISRVHEGVVAKAIPVPDHGQSIDADALWVEINKICDRRDAGIISDLLCLNQILSAVRYAPTIIQADKGDEKDGGQVNV